MCCLDNGKFWLSGTGLLKFKPSFWMPSDLLILPRTTTAPLSQISNSPEPSNMLTKNLADPEQKNKNYTC